MQKNNTLNNIDLAITNLHYQLQYDPYNSELYNNLASVYYRVNNIDQAIYNYQKSLQLNPHNWQAHYNLANCYTKKNFVPDAINHYKCSLELHPENINAIQNLGMLLTSIEEFQHALPYLETAYNKDRANKDSAEFLNYLANCYINTGNPTKAIAYLEQATALHSNNNDIKESIHHNLAILYLGNSKYIKAKEHFTMALALNNNNKTAKHMLAALNQQHTQQAPQQYIIELFDQYANYYNKHLKDTLQYKLPEKFRELYAKYNKTKAVQNTLDLGCGTGLCGIYFRDTTVNLIGVDLSKNMLLQAKILDAYDLLIQADIQQYQTFKDNYFDLIIAADMVPYTGDLENLFTNIKTLMKHDSKCIFNIELLENNDQELFKLQLTGRYAHTLCYIESLLKTFNLVILEHITTTIRLQNNVPVIGVIFLIINT